MKSIFKTRASSKKRPCQEWSSRSSDHSYNRSASTWAHSRSIRPHYYATASASTFSGRRTWRQMSGLTEEILRLGAVKPRLLFSSILSHTLPAGRVLYLLRIIHLRSAAQKGHGCLSLPDLSPNEDQRASGFCLSTKSVTHPSLLDSFHSCLHENQHLAPETPSCTWETPGRWYWSWFISKI